MEFPRYAYARKLIKRPHDAYLSHLQALINERWENSTQTIFTVYQQVDIGSAEYVEVPISIDTAIDIGTGFKKGDDFKVFSHKNIEADLKLGLMYRTEEDYWVCINTNGYASPTNSCEVRRCNNVMKWVDPETGRINEQWCAIDYELSSPRPSKDKDIVVADGHIVITVQGNDLTRSIRKNQRFIFNGLAFKVSAYQTLLDENNITFHSNLLYIDMYADTIQPSDDLVNGIANATDYMYAIELQPDVTEQISGFEGQMVATVTCNGEVADREIVWTGNEFVTVNSDGSYILNGEGSSSEPEHMVENDLIDAQHQNVITNTDQNISALVAEKVAVITATLDGNPSVTDSCNIQILEYIEDSYDIIIDPLFTEVRQSLPQTFSVYLYKNGVRQDDAVRCRTSGLSHHYFNLRQDGHDFTLSVKDISDTPLTLTFTVDDYSETIDVLLKPFF